MAALGQLAAEFFDWRHRQAPTTRDDITRVLRPAGWVPDWSGAAVASYRHTAARFAERLATEVDRSVLTVTEQTDYQLLSSAIRRIGWELDVVGRFEHDPRFYVEQALGPFYETLLAPAPFDEARIEESLRRLEFVEPSVEAAREHLARGAYGELADSALGELDGIEQTLAKVGESLAEVLPASAAAELSARLQRAIPHLVGFRRWLAGERASMQPFQAIGREAFAAFLTGVAHVPYTPDEMLVLARQEIAAASVWEVVAEGREGEQRAASSLPVDAAAQCERERVLEHEVRAYYEAHGLLSQPASLRHYYNLPRPGYLTLLRFLGVTDDLTDPSRRGVDATSYVPEPGESLAYFYRANAVDPRLGIVHEGVHSEQLALSWGHADPLRREYCDSTANEGIAFYNEELMLQAGLFEDNRQATRVLHNFMRLRAMRVVVDVRLALGEMSIEEAGEYLEQHVPMDRETALHEAAFFAATPGQGLSYQVGKWQIEELLAAALAARPDLGLRRLHDYLWLNGNVPPGLLLPELLALAP